MSENYYVGFDIGFDSVHAVVLDSKKNIVYSPESAMHFGDPVGALRDVYEDIISRYGFEDISTIAFTGSVGENIAQKTNTPYFHDTITIPLGVDVIAPDTNYVFHIGAKDSYFFEREKVKTNNGWNSFVPDHGTGTKCGGGSGILIMKQCRRFFQAEFKVILTGNKKERRSILQDQLTEIFKRAEEEISKSDVDIDIGGRCGVVIQSDMIHLQNRGERIENILKGMFRRIARNYRCDVIKTRFLDANKKAIATGGVFSNKYFVKMLESELGINVIIPIDHQKVGAIGAAINAKNIRKKFKPEELSLLARAEKEKIKTAPPLHSVLDKVKIYEEENFIEKKEDLQIYNLENNKKIEVLMGVDGGSTTTKAIIADANSLKIIAEICLNTNGRPLQKVQEMFRQIRKYIGDKIVIKGVCYTGSSGAFYYKLFTNMKKNPKIPCIDIVKDEITCHANGVRYYNNKVDTIFELGGQDAKFTLFNKDGNVKKAKMNLSCMAGTGQTMNNMVDMVGLDIKTTFHEYALKAKKTPIVDETCGVFTEAGIAKLVALGFSREEIAAAIAYGFMGGYVNKFVGNEKFGDYASAQGGPFNGKACLAALALHIGMEVHAFPHRQLFGALGAVIAVYNYIKELAKLGVEFACKFRGLDIADMEFEQKIENCSKINKDSCGLRDCKLQVYRIGDDLIYSGGLCPKGNTDTSVKRAQNYIEAYKKILNKYLAKYSADITEKNDNERVLIPRSLTFLNERGVFYSALYNSLGFIVCISQESDDEIANLGINYAHSESCYPIKIAHGHGAILKKFLRQGKDKILLVNAIGSGKEKSKFCPYVAGAGFLVKDALNIRNEDVLLPVIHFGDPHYKIEEAILKDLIRIFGGRFSLDDVERAVKDAEKAQIEFLNEVYSKGEEIIKRLKEKGEKIFIGVGRGYTLFDDKANSEVHELFGAYGLHFVPSFFFRLPSYNIEGIVENMYWIQGQSMLKYNIMAALDPELYVVRETNFNCGTDSFILYHEEDIMGIADKPHLVLQTDGHNSNAQFGTRILANYEVVKNHKPKLVKFKEFKMKIPIVETDGRIIGIPYMGDSSFVASASFRAVGIKAEVMPTRTIKSLELARKFVSTNTCRPFSFQVGDHLAWLYSLKEKGIDPNKEAAVFEPKTYGPCRFGQYSVMLRKFFDKNGFNKVPIINPDSDKDYSDFPIPKLKLARLSIHFYRGFFCSDVLFDALLRTRPYEKKTGEPDKVYDQLRHELYKLVENRASTRKLVDFMKIAKGRFEMLVDKAKKRKPIVVMNGEIFVRCHPKANQDSIRLLERYGLEVVLTMPVQWLDYINKLSISKYKDTKQWKNFILSNIKKRFIRRVMRELYEPFKHYLEGREPHDPEHIIETAQRALVYDKKIQGESTLSIGESYLFLKGKLNNTAGIYHVGPFGCMQETAATSKIQALIQQQRLNAKKMDERVIPFMDGVFGESELPNLEAEIAAFSEKCYLKKELKKVN